jgi:TatD DNase family protein
MKNPNELDAFSDKIFFIDSHIHLADSSYIPKLDEVISIAEKSNVSALIANAENFQTSLVTIDLADRYPDLVFPAIGMHPWYASSTTITEADDVAALIASKTEKLVAVGEIGLDKAYAKSVDQMESQVKVLQRMLESAEKSGLPVIIHSRKSVVEVLEKIVSYNLKKVVLHWFSGPIELVSSIMQKGYYLTFGPSVVYAKHIRELAKRASDDLILTETDGPVKYHGIFEGKDTFPDFIPIVVKEIADIKRVKMDEFAFQVVYNNLNVFEKLQCRFASYMRNYGL